jgi:predicted transcriptional regulator
MATSDSIELATELVAAYVSKNSLPKGDLPDLILEVHSSLARLVVRVKRLRPSTLRQAIEMTHAVTDSSV